MRAKLSGPVELIEALEAAVRSANGAHLETPLARRENAELRFAVKEIADIIVQFKDFAELVALCWQGIQFVRTVSAKSEVSSPLADPSASGPVLTNQQSIPIEITTASARVHLVIPLGSTPAQIEKQLAPLQQSHLP